MTDRRPDPKFTPARRHRRRRGSVSIRRLSVADVREYRQLRLRGLRECPTAFGSSHADEASWTIAMFERRLQTAPESWTFGAYAAGNLVGIVTLLRDAGAKSRHKAIVVGMYVDGRHRRGGIGRRLLREALRTAARLPGLRRIRLDVVATNRAARRLYESEGFREYGREPDALRIGGRSYAAIWLSRAIPRVHRVQHSR